MHQAILQREGISAESLRFLFANNEMDGPILPRKGSNVRLHHRKRTPETDPSLYTQRPELASAKYKCDECAGVHPENLFTYKFETETEFQAHG